MKSGPDIAYLAALIGDPARTNILTALMDGRALTASELAGEAGVTLQTTSSHLSKLSEGGLLQPRKQGRHKYFALASDEVAHVLESLMGLAASAGLQRTRTGPDEPAMRQARVCYNHLAGNMGVQLFQSLLGGGHLKTGEAVSLTAAGEKFVRDLGIDIDALKLNKTPLCRECLDWSERRSHLAGSLGRAFLKHFDEQNWIIRKPGSRIISFNARGSTAFHEAFPV